MKNKIKLIIFTLIISVGLGLGTDAVTNQVKKAPVTHAASKAAPAASYTYTPTNSLDIVANPAKYLNKRVRITAKFDKFSILGLDYKPAFRSSDKYISFLIKRDDVINHTVPLSEMKIFLKRDEAEKHVDLEAGDIVQFEGIVFSDALGDTWIEVEKFTVLSSKAKEKNSTKK